MTPQIAAFFAEIGLEATPELVAVSKELGLREGSDFIELDKDDVTSLQRCMPKIPGKRFKKKVEDLKVRRGPLSLRTSFSLRAPPSACQDPRPDCMAARPMETGRCRRGRCRRGRHRPARRHCGE